MSNLKAVLTADTGTTELAVRFLRNFNLEGLYKLLITPEEQDDGVVVSFFFDEGKNDEGDIIKYKVDVSGAFCVGYRSKGSLALHDLMIDAGFSESQAEAVFSMSKYEKAGIFK